MAILGIDVGSTALKAALYREDGSELAKSAREYRSAAGADGLHPDELWSALCEVVGAVTGQVPQARVRALAISSHGESFVPVDRAGNALCPFILNTAACGETEAAEFADHFGRTGVFELTGLPPHSMYTLPKIVWLRRNRPDVFARAAHFLCVEDYILARAGVGSYISASLASRTMALDLTSGAWAPSLLDFAGIARDALSRPVPSGAAVGVGSAAACRELHLPSDAIWVAGGHDQGCCSLGAGGLGDGAAVDGTGTYECVTVPVLQPLLSPQALLLNFSTERHTVPGLYLTACYTAAGVAMRWFRDILSGSLAQEAAAGKVDPYDLMLRELPDDPTSLLVFPHLIGTGTPWLARGARGAVVGIADTTSYAEIAKAIIEGITLEMQWNLQLQRRLGIRIERIHAVGGGAKSPAWLQMKADIFEQEIVAIKGEASCAGAAISAGVGAGIFADAHEGSGAFIRRGAVYQPRPRHAARYREKLAAYQDLAQRIYGFRIDNAATPAANRELASSESRV